MQVEITENIDLKVNVIWIIQLLNLGRFSTPRMRSTFSRTWKYVLGKSILKVRTCENSSPYLQLEQQRTR